MLPKLKVPYTTGRAITNGMKARFVPSSGVLEKPYLDQLRMSLSTHFRRQSYVAIRMFLSHPCSQGRYSGTRHAAFSLRPGLNRLGF